MLTSYVPGRYKTQVTGHCFTNTESILYIHFKEEPQISFYKSCVLCPPLCTSTSLEFSWKNSKSKFNDANL